MQDVKKRESVAFITLQELLELQSNGKQFSISKYKTKALRTGQYTSSLLARGMEFAETRRYLPGDEVRNIDWKVTARTGKVHTKLFTEENEKQVLIAVDMRPNMFFATKGVFKSVQAASLAANISWSAFKATNALGGIVFDGVNSFCSKPIPGKRGILTFLHGLSEKSTVIPKKNKSEEEAISSALLSLKTMTVPGSLVFILSDFRYLSTDAKNILLQISSMADLVCCFLYDPFEMDLPIKGNYPVTNGEVKIQFSANNETDRNNYKNLGEKRKEDAALACRMRHTPFIECSTEDDPLKILKQHFN